MNVLGTGYIPSYCFVSILRLRLKPRSVDQLSGLLGKVLNTFNRVTGTLEFADL